MGWLQRAAPVQTVQLSLAVRWDSHSALPTLAVKSVASW
jgi:hypothetical protein